MPRLKEIEICVVVDDDGGYECGVEAGDATDRYEENVQETINALGIRTIRVKLTVPLPELIVLRGEISPADEAAKLTEVASV